MVILEKHCAGLRDVVQFATPAAIKDRIFQLDENYMIALTKENTEKVHACVFEDARYNHAPDKAYYDSNAKSLADYSRDELTELIRLIAVSNSTRSNTASVRALAEYIYQNCDSVLRKLDDGDISLVSDLAGVKMPRREDSLISKICTYLCEYEFKKFNFVINDTVVRSILPYYLDYYRIDKSLWKKNGKIKKFDKLSYGELHMLMEKLKESISDELSLHDIDLILWYCYKSDAVRMSIANAIVSKEL